MLHSLKKAGIRKRLWSFLLLPIAIFLTVFSSGHPAFAEWYATHVYSKLSLIVNRLTGIVPFSIAELLVIFLVFAGTACILWFSIKMIRGKENRILFLLRSIVNLLVVLCIVYFLFVVDCGVNYYRYTFADTSGLTIEPSSQTELKELCTSLAEDVSTLRPTLKTNARGIMELDTDSLQTTAREAKQAYDKIQPDYPLLTSGYGAPKLVRFSRLMSLANITGIFFPFTFEANVNADVPDYTIPVTMCHELSHLRGYMREDEANFIGYLVCKQSGNPDFIYSGDMLAFTYASNALFSADADAAGKLYASLNAGVKADFSYNSQYWKQFEGPVAEASTRVNDHYLKANRQEDGVKSYGRMVDLLLAEQRAEKNNFND